MRIRDQGRARSALKAVEIAGDQRVEQDLVVLDIGDIDVEADFFEEAALRRHGQNAGIALRLDEGMAPRFGLRRGRTAAESDEEAGAQKRADHGTGHCGEMAAWRLHRRDLPDAIIRQDYTA